MEAAPVSTGVSKQQHGYHFGSVCMVVIQLLQLHCALTTAAAVAVAVPTVGGLCRQLGRVEGMNFVLMPLECC